MTRLKRVLSPQSLLILAILCVVAMLGQSSLFASSHSEAPGISRIPSVDGTDLYAFRSPDNPSTVTFIACYYPLEEPNAGPNWYRFNEDAKYTIEIDNDQDAVEDIVYEFRFSNTIKNGGTFLSFLPGITSLNSGSYNLTQSYQVTQVRNGARTSLGSGLVAPPPYVGNITTPSYNSLFESGVYSLANGIRVFAGQTDDPFFADLAFIFDGVSIRKPVGNNGGGKDGLGGFNVQAIAIQVPINQLTKNGSTPTSANDPAAIIGLWTDAYLPKTAVQGAKGPAYSGPFVRVSRLGMPLVNEVVIALEDKEKWNSSEPKNDGQFLEYVTNSELAGLFNAIYGINVPPNPRNDLVSVFLTGVAGLNKAPNVTPSEELRLNVAIPVTKSPNRLGVLAGDTGGFPNGRRLTDDIIDIEERVVAGVLVQGFNVAPNNQLGDGVDANDRAFTSTFPYLAPPANPKNHTHHKLTPAR